MKLTLLHVGYRPDYQAHQWLSDIPADFRQVPAVTLSGKTCTDGVFNADPVTFTGVNDSPLGSGGDLPGATGGLLLYVDKDASTPILACLGTLDGAWPAVIVGTKTFSIDWANSLSSDS